MDELELNSSEATETVEAEVNTDPVVDETTTDDVTDQKTYTEAEYKELQKHSREHEKNARKLNDALEATKKELDAANQAKEEALAELATLRSVNERNKLISTIASEEDVDRAILEKMTGDDEDTIRSNASLLKGLKPTNSYPKVIDSGDPGKFKTISKDEILAINDPKKQRQLIAENLELF